MYIYRDLKGEYVYLGLGPLQLPHGSWNDLLPVIRLSQLPNRFVFCF